MEKTNLKTGIIGKKNKGLEAFLRHS